MSLTYKITVCYLLPPKERKSKKPTIYEALCTKLGREATHKEETWYICYQYADGRRVYIRNPRTTKILHFSSELAASKVCSELNEAICESIN